MTDGTVAGRNYLLLSLFVMLLVDEVFQLGLVILPGLSFKNIYLYLIVLYLTTSSVVRGRFVSARFPQFVTVFSVLCVYGLASWAVSLTVFSYYNGLMHLQMLKSLLVDPLLFFCVFYFGCSSRSDALWISKRIALAIALMSIILLMDYFNIPDLGLMQDREDGRLHEGIGTSNQFAAFLWFFVLSMSPLVFSRRRSYLVLVGGLAALTLILLTGSRGAVAGLVGGAFATTFVLRRHLDMRNVAKIGSVAVLGLAVVAGIVVWTNPEMLAQRLEATDTSNLSAASAGRTVMWSAALVRMWEHPYSFVTGFGWDMFLYSRIYPDPHNHYLFLFYNLGAIGLGMFLWVLVSIVSTVINALNAVDDELRACLIGFLYGLAVMLVCVFFVVLYTPWLFIWSYIGLMAKAAWLAHEPAAEQVRDAALSKMSQLEYYPGRPWSR